MHIEISSSPTASNPAKPSVVYSPGVNGLLVEIAAASITDVVIPHLERQIVAIEDRLHLLKGSSADDLVDDLLQWGRGASESAAEALSAGQHAIVYAWATGCVFNLAKENVGHGPFGRWRDTKAGELGISVRKAQHWMKLAKDCWDVRALLVPGATLTGAYRATGVLPESTPPPPGEDADGGDCDQCPSPPTPSPAEAVLSVLSEGRKRLRHLLQSGEIIGDEDRDRLVEEKSAIITLIDKLLNSSSHE
jgi:hypothetical protein